MPCSKQEREGRCIAGKAQQTVRQAKRVRRPGLCDRVGAEEGTWRIRQVIQKAKLVGGYRQKGKQSQTG